MADVHHSPINEHDGVLYVTSVQLGIGNLTVENKTHFD